jgi:hypothetical protein
MDFVPAAFSFDRPKPFELGTHLLDFPEAKDILDDEKTVLVEFAPLLRSEIGSRDPELGKSRFGVHWASSL